MKSPVPQRKTLLITADYLPDTGGVAWYYANLVSKINKAGLPPSLQAFWEGGQVDVLKLNAWAMTRWWPCILFPLIHFTIKYKTNRWWVGQVLPVGTIVWFLSLVWKKPYIVSTHGMDILVPLHTRRKRWLIGKILKRAELITVNSNWTKKKLVEAYAIQDAERRIQVVYPEPKPKVVVSQEKIDELRRRLGIPLQAPILLTVARLVKRKGYDRVLGALPEVWKTIGGLHYIIVGEGEELNHLLSLKSQLSGGEKVHVVGAVRDEELACYYSLALAFILVTRDIEGDVEGYGIVYREADQYSLPIIATVSGGTEEAITPCKRLTRISNGDNRKEVAEAILNAIGNHAL